MVTRKYRDCGSSRVVAGIIASEVIESGKSDQVAEDFGGALTG